MSTAVEPAAPSQTASGSAPSLVIGSLLGSVVILAGLVAAGYAAAAVPESTPYLEVARIATFLGTLVLAVAVGGLVANTNPARGVRGGIILTVSVVVATAFVAAAFYSNFRDGLVGPIITGLVLLVGAFAVFRILTSQTGVGWCRGLDDQGWASTFNHKRSQGLHVRRYTMIGFLVLGITGAISLYGAAPFSPSRQATAQTARGNGTAADRAGKAALPDAAPNKVHQPLNYHVPFTEVTDPAGYPLNAKGRQRNSLEVEAELKKEPGVADAAVIVTPGDETADRLIGFVELKPQRNPDGTTRAVSEADRGKLNEQLRERVGKEFGVEMAANDLRVVDSVMRSRSGQVNRRFYREQEAGREANEDATALMPLLPVANLTLPLLICLGTLWLAWRAVNVPTFGDFLIATEAEMNKVSWTPRRRLVQDTIVVLVCLLLLTLFLLVIDLFWGWLLSLDFIGVLPKKGDTGGTTPDGGVILKW